MLSVEERPAQGGTWQEEARYAGEAINGPIERERSRIHPREPPDGRARSVAQTYRADK